MIDEFLDWFETSKTLCPMTHFSIVSSQSEITLENSNDLTGAHILVDTALGLDSSVTVFGHTYFSQSKGIPISIIICGNEEIIPIALDKVEYILQKEEAFTLDVTEWFSVSSTDANECA